MTYSSAGLTHGGVAFYKQTISSLLASGWSEVDSISDGALSSATITQSDTMEIGFNVSGFPLGNPIALPVMFVTDFTIYRDWITVATLGVDLTVDRVNGTFTLLASGLFDGGSGFAVGTLGVAAGYNIREGWKVYGSSGVSTTENLLVGATFVNQTGNPANPERTGLRWKLFSSYTFGDGGPAGAPSGNKNADADDLISLIRHNGDWIFRAFHNADKIIYAGGTEGCYNAWGYVGALDRVRPVTEQAIIVAMAGNTSAATDDAAGIVGKTDEPGVMGANHGCVYLYDLGVFSSSANPVELNANHWSREVGNVSNGLTPSHVPVSTPIPGIGAGQNLYFEIHPIIAGRGVSLLNDVNNVLYGDWGGLFSVLSANAQNNLQLTIGSAVYRLVSVGSSSRRFIAIAEA